MAYCLMGLFDVSMPLLYGEGEKAFWRLQQEILKDTTDHTLFAWKGDGYTSGMFARSPADFVPAVDMTTHRRDLQNSASSLTNRVLQIELPLAPTPIPDVYTAVLNCYPWRSEGVDDFYPVALLLRRQFQGRNDFVRVQNNEMIDFRHLKTGSYLDQAAHIDPTYLYVKQVKPIEVTYNMRKVFFAMGRPYRENDSAGRGVNVSGDPAFANCFMPHRNHPVSDSTKPYPLLCFSSQTVMGDALRDMQVIADAFLFGEWAGTRASSIGLAELHLHDTVRDEIDNDVAECVVSASLDRGIFTQRELTIGLSNGDDFWLEQVGPGLYPGWWTRYMEQQQTATND